MSATPRPRRHPHAVYKVVDDEAVIVVPSDEPQHIVLNDVGAHIWELLDGEHDMEALEAAITDAFDVEREVAARDLRELVDSLRDHGALAPEAEGEASS